MAWEKSSLLKMMQANYRCYGKEILEIESASERWLCNYFWKRLCSLLDYREKTMSKLFTIIGGREIEDIVFKEKTPVNADQCVEIGNFLGRGVVMFDYYSGLPVINRWDSRIILDYIFNGGSLDDEPSHKKY